MFTMYVFTMCTLCFHAQFTNPSLLFSSISFATTMSTHPTVDPLIVSHLLTHTCGYPTNTFSTFLQPAPTLPPPPNPNFHASFTTLLNAHIAHATPIQYLLGQWDFHDLTNVICRPPTLIPRPETEQLGKVALRNIDPRAASKGGSGVHSPQRHSRSPCATSEQTARSEHDDTRTNSAFWSRSRRGMRANGATRSRTARPFVQAADMLTNGASRSQTALSTPPLFTHVVGAPVEHIIATISPRASVLDVGTGTGCIPCAVSKQVEGVQITAIDVCEQAVALARENVALFEGEFRKEARVTVEHVGIGEFGTKGEESQVSGRLCDSLRNSPKTRPCGRSIPVARRHTRVNSAFPQIASK